MRKTRPFTTCFILFVTVIAVSSVWTADANAQSEKEKELIATLRSDGPKADKAIACKKLAVLGSSAAVEDLAKLLPDEQLSSWARIALEAIPGAAADEALRKSLDSLNGKLLVGTINSIGVRRDAGAVETLVARLKADDAEVASAAAVALGHIGNAAAAKSLRASLASAPPKVRSAVAEGCILCAEKSAADGRLAEAAAIYDEVRTADVPKQRVLEAVRGSILAHKDEGIAILVEQLRSPDNGLFQIALSTAREIQGTKIDEVLAAELGRATPERAPLVIVAMADRKESVVLSAVLKAAGSGPKPVRLAAIAALGRVGDASCLSSLVEIAQQDDAELTQTARAALGELPGEKVNQEIIARLANAQGKTLPLLIEVVGSRRINAMETLLKAVNHSDAAVRSAALTSLGNTIPAKSLSVLISQAVSPKHAEDAAVAQQALKAACVRMADREACAGELAAAYEKSPVATKTVLLQILGAVGGTKALNTIGNAAKTTDPLLQDASTKLLGEWMTIDAAPVLLDLTKSAPGEKYQVRALRGYIRIARQFTMSEPERAEMCAKAFDASRQVAEQKLVLDVLKRYPSVDTLKIAVKAAQMAELKEDATQVAVAIAQKAKGPEVRELLSKVGLERVKLEIVKAEYGAGSNQKDVTEVLRKLVGDLPLIPLASTSYNASFGGDPSPGSVKQLKVQYKINGKAGEASFAENDLILLPTPK